MDHLYRTVQDYISGQISEINIINVTEAAGIFKIFKELCLQLENDKTRFARRQSSSSDLLPIRRKTGKSSSKSSLNLNIKNVG